jgi:hypothetical protein
MKLLKIAALAMAATLVAVAVPDAAQAATGKNGTLESGEFGLYYSPGESGPVLDLYVSDADFSNDVFPGTNIPANDNTASYNNRDTYWWNVFTNANYSGSHGCVSAGYVGDASSTFRNTISSAYFSSSGC